MFDRYDWREVSGADLKLFLKRINPIQGKHTASETSAAIESCPLPFYASTALVRVSDTAWPPNTGPFWFLAKRGIMLLLDGSSSPIHDVNEFDSVKINENNVLEYLRFFCYFSHGDEGPFLIVDDVTHPALDWNKLNDVTRKVIEGALRPLTLKGKTPDGAFEASATVLYGDSLSFCRFSVTEDGTVEMIDDDEPFASDLPVRKIKPNY